jgi:hypothetical protein
LHRIRGSSTLIVFVYSVFTLHGTTRGKMSDWVVGTLNISADHRINRVQTTGVGSFLPLGGCGRWRQGPVRKDGGGRVDTELPCKLTNTPINYWLLSRDIMKD